MHACLFDKYLMFPKQFLRLEFQEFKFCSYLKKLDEKKLRVKLFWSFFLFCMIFSFSLDKILVKPIYFYFHICRALDVRKKEK